MNRKPRQRIAYQAMSWYVLLAMVRNRSTLIFGLAFPIAFILVFGILGSSTQSVNLGLPDSINSNNPVVQAISNSHPIKIKTDSKANLDNLLRQGKIDAELDISTEPNNHFKATLITSSGNPSGAGVATSVISGIVNQMNLQLSGVKNPPIALSVQEVSGRQARYIDFALPGQIGFSLLSLAIFGTVFGFIALKRQLILKRMFATPVRAITILLAQGTARLVMVLIQTVLILGVGVFAFNFYLPHGFQTLAELLLLSTIGLVCFMAFGLFISGLADDENSAGPLVNLVTLPQFLLSGVFFSSDNFPAWIQPLANNLPLSYFNLAVRKVTTEGGSIIDTWPYVLGLLTWGAVMAFLASKTFKWE